MMVHKDAIYNGGSWETSLIPLVFKGRPEEDKGTSSADIEESMIVANKVCKGPKAGLCLTCGAS